MKWWVAMDWAGGHDVQFTDDDPSVYGDRDWSGPFDSFTAMRKHIVQAGVYEASEIVNQTRDWRHMRKGEALGVAAVEGHDWSEEAGW